MNYFSDCTTPEERKIRYRTLAKLHHPDKGGQVKIMQEVNKQYKALGATVKNTPEYDPNYDSSFDPATEEVESTGTAEDVIKSERFKNRFDVGGSDYFWKSFKWK